MTTTNTEVNAIEVKMNNHLKMLEKSVSKFEEGTRNFFIEMKGKNVPDDVIQKVFMNQIAEICEIMSIEINITVQEIPEGMEFVSLSFKKVANSLKRICNLIVKEVDGLDDASKKAFYDAVNTSFLQAKNKLPEFLSSVKDVETVMDNKTTIKPSEELTQEVQNKKKEKLVKKQAKAEEALKQELRKIVEATSLVDEVKEAAKQLVKAKKKANKALKKIEKTESTNSFKKYNQYGMEMIDTYEALFR